MTERLRERRAKDSRKIFFPQQPERLGVLPIKLRGGLGQPPETLHQVPRGSAGMEPVPKWRFHSWNVRFREVPKSRSHSWNVRFREVPKWRFHSWNVRFREVPKWRFHSWNVRFWEVPKWRFHSWNVRFREVPKWRFHSWNVRFREVPKSRFHSWNVRFREVQGSIHETLGSERFRSEGSIHETLGSERFRSEGSIHETLGSVRFRSQGSIHETLGHFSKYGMCLHITCFVFHIACFLFHIACFLLLIICQSEKQFLSTSCWGFHMALFYLRRIYWSNLTSLPRACLPGVSFCRSNSNSISGGLVRLSSGFGRFCQDLGPQQDPLQPYIDKLPILPKHKLTPTSRSPAMEVLFVWLPPKSPCFENTFGISKFQILLMFGHLSNSQRPKVAFHTVWWTQEDLHHLGDLLLCRAIHHGLRYAFADYHLGAALPTRGTCTGQCHRDEDHHVLSQHVASAYGQWFSGSGGLYQYCPFFVH